MYALLLMVALGDAPYDVTILRSAAPAAVDVSQYACKLTMNNSAGHVVAIGSGVKTSKGVLTCLHVVQGQSIINVTCDGETASAT